MKRSSDSGLSSTASKEAKLESPLSPAVQTTIENYFRRQPVAIPLERSGSPVNLESTIDVQGSLVPDSKLQHEQSDAGDLVDGMPKPQDTSTINEPVIQEGGTVNKEVQVISDENLEAVKMASAFNGALQDYKISTNIDAINYSDYLVALKVRLVKLLPKLAEEHGGI